jgi:hypothetical protein
MAAVILAVCGLWIAAPLSIALLGGSVGWMIAAAVAGLLAVGLALLIAAAIEATEYGEPKPSEAQAQAEAALDELTGMRERLNAMDPDDPAAAQLRKQMHEGLDKLRTSLSQEMSS